MNSPVKFGTRLVAAIASTYDRYYSQQRLCPGQAEYIIQGQLIEQLAAFLAKEKMVKIPGGYQNVYQLSVYVITESEYKTLEAQSKVWKDKFKDCWKTAHGIWSRQFDQNDEQAFEEWYKKEYGDF